VVLSRYLLRCVTEAWQSKPSSCADGGCGPAALITTSLAPVSIATTSAATHAAALGRPYDDASSQLHCRLRQLPQRRVMLCPELLFPPIGALQPVLGVVPGQRSYAMGLRAAATTIAANTTNTTSALAAANTTTATAPALLAAALWSVGHLRHFDRRRVAAHCRG